MSLNALLFQALELMEKCIILFPYTQKLGEVIRDILLCDSSIHSTLFRVICITPQALEVNLSAICLIHMHKLVPQLLVVLFIVLMLVCFLAETLCQPAL